jgi:hypothetical protein
LMVGLHRSWTNTLVGTSELLEANLERTSAAMLLSRQM